MEAPDELGAHVSAAGGTWHAPARAAVLESVVLQLFTKSPQRWAERTVEAEEARAFRAEYEAHGIRVSAAHDSYLINLASPDPELQRRSRVAFTGELRRAVALGLDFVVTHPGNATDGDLERGRRQNADAIMAALDSVPGPICVLVEGTAGAASSLGSTFRQLAGLVHPIADRHPDRIGVCLDTCHLWAAGYDLRDLDGVLVELDRDVGLSHLRLLHLNDSATPFHSRRDRHADIGAGSIGGDVFRAVMTHPALMDIPKLIETPKGRDAVGADRANLTRLRRYRRTWGK